MAELRFMYDTIYLRAGSVNLFNDMAGVNFSCDGLHCMPWGEFLDNSLSFWSGIGAAAENGPQPGSD